MTGVGPNSAYSSKYSCGFDLHHAYIHYNILSFAFCTQETSLAIVEREISKYFIYIKTYQQFVIVAAIWQHLLIMYNDMYESMFD